MLGKEILLKLLDYNADANRRVFALAEKCDSAQLHALTELGHGSLYATLFHLIRVELLWGDASQERDGDAALALRVEDYPTVAQLTKLWTQQSQDERAFIVAFDEDALTKQITRRRPDGAEFTFTRWHMLMQLLMHSMQHRTECAALLTSYGHSPGDLDFLYFAMRG